MAQHSLIHQQNLWKAFLVFLLPLIATNILQSLSGTINTVFVGQMLGVNAIAAVAVFFPDPVLSDGLCDWFIGRLYRIDWPGLGWKKYRKSALCGRFNFIYDLDWRQLDCTFWGNFC